MKKNVVYKIGDWVKLKAEKGWRLTNCVIVDKEKDTYYITTPESFIRYKVKKSDIAYKLDRPGR